MHLSDVFKFTQGLGQKGHQIGRKVGDAVELVTLAMIYKDSALSQFLVIEDGIEGATTAKHTVEFAFYNLEENRPSKKSLDLFGIIECKKVGVEQTIKQNFKSWLRLIENKRDFHLTDGYAFLMSPSKTNFKWTIKLTAIGPTPKNLQVTAYKNLGDGNLECFSNAFHCETGSQILIGYDVKDRLFILGPSESLSDVEYSIKKCTVVQIKSVGNLGINTIHVNESLSGPQTPEKAKQASFVSLDVRKRVLGRFDKSTNNDFVSILVIGEASHWEEKSRSMIRLCNDYNVIIPDYVLVKIFESFEAKFGSQYQNMINKTKYRLSQEVRDVISGVIEHFNSNVLLEMESQEFIKFEHFFEHGKNKVRLSALNQN